MGHLTSLSPVLQTAGLDLWAAILPELNLCLETEDISLRAQMVKNLPAMQETRVQSLGQEDPLEEIGRAHV